MSKRPAVISVGGHEYRLVTTLTQGELEELAADVSGRLARLSAAQQIHPQALLLVALSLAQELREERDRRAELKEKSRTALLDLLQRVEDALGSVDENGEPLTGSPQPAAH